MLGLNGASRTLCNFGEEGGLSSERGGMPSEKKTELNPTKRKQSGRDMSFI